MLIGLTFAARLKKLRTDLNLTQSQFCEKIEITQATLSSYENGQKIPNVGTITTIAKACNVSIDWLLGLSERKNNEIETVSDVIELLVNLSTKTPLTVTSNKVYYEGAVCEDDYCIVSNIVFDEEGINSFLQEWEKMSKLHFEEHLIDDDVYNLWIEKCLIKYSDYYLDPNHID